MMRTTADGFPNNINKNSVKNYSTKNMLIII